MNNTLEQKLKTPNFWLWLGTINHSIALAAIAIGCVYSGFTCQGELMKDALSIYAFTLFTPQLALKAIILMALLMVISSWRQLTDSWKSLSLFIGTLGLLIAFTYWQQ